jgi:hypothetical protein
VLLIGSNANCYSVLRYCRDWIVEQIQNWLIDEFLKKTRTSNLTAHLVLSLVSFDLVGIIKIILTKYGLEYLIKYIVLISML